MNSWDVQQVGPTAGATLSDPDSIHNSRGSELVGTIQCRWSIIPRVSMVLINHSLGHNLDDDGVDESLQ